MEHPPLTASFLAHAKGRFARPADVTAFEELLVRTVESARAEWPGVTLPAEVFIRHLAGRLPEAEPARPLEAVLAEVSVPELYLACACAHGVPAALATLEREYLAKLPRLLRHLNQPAAVIDDVCQSLRVKLLVHTPEAEARIADYAGNGALLAWVKVIAVREALKQIPKKGASEEEGEPPDVLKGPGDGPELELIKKRFRAEFLQALRETFSALTDEERRLLQLHFKDGLSTPQLGVMFGVNQATAWRRLNNARQKVSEETKRRLQERLGLSTVGYKSLLVVLDSQLDLRMSQLFREEDAPAPPSAAEKD